MTPAEMIEVSRIHNLVSPGTGLLSSRPFIAPHHSATEAGMLGGGNPVRPGQITMAHKGVLMLDEFLEFDRVVLEGLRQPLEDGVITVARANEVAVLPADFVLVAACNPCPCGWDGSEQRRCICTEEDKKRYWRAASGPILDRIDITLMVPAVPVKQVIGGLKGADGDTSDVIRSRVEDCRQRQESLRGVSNARLTRKQLAEAARLDEKSELLLERGISNFGLSMRAIERIRKLARTIADLAGRDAITSADVAEAFMLRKLDITLNR